MLSGIMGLILSHGQYFARRVAAGSFKFLVKCAEALDERLSLFIIAFSEMSHEFSK
jgi:hypothetical protein